MQASRPFCVDICLAGCALGEHQTGRCTSRMGPMTGLVTKLDWPQATPREDDSDPAPNPLGPSNACTRVVLYTVYRNEYE